jgi:hypothetical protein
MSVVRSISRSGDWSRTKVAGVTRVGGSNP